MNRAALVIASLSVLVAPSLAWGASHGHAHDDATTHDHGHGHWTAPAHVQSVANPMPVDSASLQIGAELYRENCVACHGAQGPGDGDAVASLETAPADLMQMAPTHADGDLAWKIENGRGEMPGWSGILSTDEIWHVVNYLKNLPRIASISDDAHGHGGNDHGHGNVGHSHSPNAQPHVD